MTQETGKWFAGLSSSHGRGIEQREFEDKLARETDGRCSLPRQHKPIETSMYRSDVWTIYTQEALEKRPSWKQGQHESARRESISWLICLTRFYRTTTILEGPARRQGRQGSQSRSQTTTNMYRTPLIRPTAD